MSRKKFKRGDRIFHPAYGKGTIKKVHDCDYSVEFDKKRERFHDCGGDTEFLRGFFIRFDENIQLIDEQFLTEVIQ